MRSSKKCSKIPISVLRLPPKNLFVSAQSPNCEYELYHVAGKKMCIEAYRTFVSKAKLFSNLEIYEWRNQTQFPIARTKYVTIEQNHQQLGQQIALTVYNQHCPLKLNRIYEMTLAQAIYMLKESIIGFQRLYNRFGAFQVKQGMIAVNQKGFCRVWLNENFSINAVGKPIEGEAKMLESIYDLMEKHCQQTKSTKKLFGRLKNCKNFLSALKEIGSFVLSSKLFVSSRYVISPASCKQINSTQTLNLMKTECVSLQNIRYSIVSGNIRSNKTQEAKLEGPESSPNAVLNENQIKRFRSMDKIKAANVMKISDGQTAYTRNNRETKCSNLGASQRDVCPQKTIKDDSKKIRKWLEDSSFVMELEQDKKIKRDVKEKKQMSYSTDVVIKQRQQKERSGSKSPRKLSVNVSSNRQESPYYRFQGIPKGQGYASEFSCVLDSDVKQQIVSTPRTVNRRDRSKIIEEQTDKSQTQHMDTIMKNNGWNGISAFLAVPKQLKESFHEGHEENKVLLDCKLHKLEGLGMRPVAMSLMPCQYQDII